MKRRNVRIPNALLDRAKACAEAAKLTPQEWLRRAFAKLDREGWEVLWQCRRPITTRANSQPRSIPQAWIQDRTGREVVAGIAWAVIYCETRITTPFVPPPEGHEPYIIMEIEE